MTGREGADDLAEEIAAMRSRLYRFACTLTSDREEAADLAQEALERGIRARDAFTPGTNLKAWLFAILHNAYANHRRSAGRFQGWAAIEDPDVGPDVDRPINPVEHEVLRRAHLHDVLRALDALPGAYALPLRLVAIDELTYAEVADILGVPAGTVMSRVYRARRLLLRGLAEEAP